MKMTLRLEGKIALVTGASSGLGKATAIKFAKEGATVICASRRKKETEETVREIHHNGGHSISIPTDISKSEEVDDLISKIISDYGKIDIAYNNAGGFFPEGKIHDALESDWNALIDINLKGTWLCMKYQLPHMLEKGCGSIINVASSAAIVGWDDGPLYSASKAGVIGLTKSSALQYAPFGIRINVICPAFTRIELLDELEAENPNALEAYKNTIPLGRLGRKEEIAEAVTWLASDASSFCVGHVLALDGGQTVGMWGNQHVIPPH